MSDPSNNDATPRNWTVRRFQPADAPGVTQLVELVYGDSYYPPELYSPQRIVQLNESGDLISVLAVDGTEVIGHYGLERSPISPIAEASDAIVATAFRHHHIMEDMRVVLVEAAAERRLIGLVGYPVTNHLFSQKADEHFGASPCGIAPGLWPRSFHNMPEPLTQRMSFVIYFKFLRPAGEVVHAATAHGEILTRIARQWGVEVRELPPAKPTGTGEISVERAPEVQTATIRVHRGGTDSAAMIRNALAVALKDGAKAVELELPLAQPTTAEICLEAESSGFFFCGLGSAFAADGDALLMQYLAEDIDPSLIQIENSFARQLLDYVNSQRERARRMNA